MYSLTSGGLGAALGCAVSGVLEGFDGKGLSPHPGIALCLGGAAVGADVGTSTTSDRVPGCQGG